MSAIITEKFRQHNAGNFFESFSESSANVYYLMIGKATPFTSGTTGGTDNSPPTPADDVSTEFYTWDSTVALKNITSSDVSYALPRRDWTNSTTYDMYDDNISSSNAATSGATSLYQSTFFFRTSDNRVYKVLDNNGGTGYSGAEPTSESTSPFALGGYVLKYMYKITASEQTKFLTADFMPVSTDSTVSLAAVDGAIESLQITAGSGYTDGTYYAAVYGDGANAGTSSGAIVSIVISLGVIVIVIAVSIIMMVIVTAIAPISPIIIIWIIVVSIRKPLIVTAPSVPNSKKRSIAWVKTISSSVNICISNRMVPPITSSYL